MSIFDNNSPSFVDFVNEGLKLGREQRLLTAYSEQIKGVGAEALADNPAHQLIQQTVIDRYGERLQPGVGNEVIGAVVIGGAALAAVGYAAFKKLMIAKNSPVLKDLKTAEQKLNTTYTAAWLNGKESVEKDVGCGIITKLFTGKDFASASKELDKYITDLCNKFKKVSELQMKTWKAIEPEIYRWGDAKDPHERKKIVDDLVAKYSWDVWKNICADIPLKEAEGKAEKLPALTKDEYGKAVALIKSVLAKLTIVDDLAEDVYHNTGLWEYLDQFGDDADGIWSFGYAERVNDYYGPYSYRIHAQLIDIGRGLEEWIVKSFK